MNTWPENMYWHLLKRNNLIKNCSEKGEKPTVYLDFPIDVTDYELIDLFNWQDKAKEMISQFEFVRMVDVQSETINRYIKEGKIIPDMEVPMGNNKSFKYFYEETVKNMQNSF